MSESNQNTHEKVTFDFTHDLQIQIIAMILWHPEYYQKHISVIKPEYFENPILQNIMKLIMNYYKSYNRVPELLELEEELDVFLKNNPKQPKEEYKRIIKIIHSLRLDDFRYVWDKVLDFAQYQGVKEAVMNAVRKGIKERNYDKIVEDIIKARTLGIESKFEIIGAYDFLKKELPPRDIYAEKWIERFALTMIAGVAKIGKSTLVMNLMIDLALGRKFLNKFEVPKPRRILYIQQEIAERVLQERIGKKMMKHEEVNKILNNLEILTTFEKQLKIDNVGDRNQIFRWIEERAPNLDLVVFDPLINFHSKSENDSIQMTEILNYFLYMIRKFKIGVILIHHHGKATDAERSKVHLSRGSSVLADIPDSVINILPLPKKYKNANLPHQFEHYAELTFDLRNDASPSNLTALRNEGTLWYETTEVEKFIKKKLYTKDVVEILKSHGKKMLQTELMGKLMKKVSERTAKEIIKEAKDKKLIGERTLPGKGNPKELELLGIKSLWKKDD